MAAQQAAHALALRLGDSNLVLAQRLGEWVGKGPAIEEDMALANTALDLLGQARWWLSLAGQLEGAVLGNTRTEDELAYWREDSAFTNALLCELPNALGGSRANTSRDYAATLMRQFLYDAWHYLVLERVQGSAAYLNASDIAQKALKEVAYHVRRSADLVVRLGDGTRESQQRMQAALNQLWPYCGELFADALFVAQWPLADLWPAWLAFVQDTLSEATLQCPDPKAWMHKGVLQGGTHTEHLGYLLAEMQHLARAHPGAQW